MFCVFNRFQVQKRLGNYGINTYSVPNGRIDTAAKFFRFPMIIVLWKKDAFSEFMKIFVNFYDLLRLSHRFRALFVL